MNFGKAITTKIANARSTSPMLLCYKIRNKKIKTNLEPTEANKELFEVMDRALQFVLKNDMSQYQILKWETESWGEIPADFGRK
jgi:hypothetical protein